MSFVFDNNVQVLIAASVSAVDTSITIDAGVSPKKTPPDPSGETSYMSLVDDLYQPTKIEVVTYTGLTDNGNGTFTLTGVTRAQESTSATTWSIGDVAYQAIPASLVNSLQTSYEPVDADILRADTSDNLVVGYTTDVESLGSVTSITPNLTTEWLKSATITGNLTINEPADGSTGGCIILLTVDASGPYIVTLGTSVSAIGAIPDLAANANYECRLIKHSDTLTTVEIIGIS